MMSKMLQTPVECLDRLRDMIDDEGEKYDLSPKDKEALRWVYDVVHVTRQFRQGLSQRGV